MKGLDTNVLVRYLTKDDPGQTAVATREIEACATVGEKMLVQPIVLCELIWVLETAYEFRKEEIVPVLEQILRTGQFEFPSKDLLWTALADYRTGKADFSDYLIGRFNESDGAALTLSFDRSLRENPRFRILS